MWQTLKALPCLWGSDSLIRDIRGFQKGTTHSCTSRCCEVAGCQTAGPNTIYYRKMVFFRTWLRSDMWTLLLWNIKSFFVWVGYILFLCCCRYISWYTLERRIRDNAVKVRTKLLRKSWFTWGKASTLLPRKAARYPALIHLIVFETLVCSFQCIMA